MVAIAVLASVVVSGVSVLQRVRMIVDLATKIGIRYLIW